MIGIVVVHVDEREARPAHDHVLDRPHGLRSAAGFGNVAVRVDPHVAQGDAALQRLAAAPQLESDVRGPLELGDPSSDERVVHGLRDRERQH